MNGRWWRAYSEARYDPKLQSLSPEMFRYWFNLCCLAAERNGEVTSALDASYALNVTESKAMGIIAVLAGKGLFDQVKDGYFEPHNWKKRQYKTDGYDKTNAERQKRYRNAKKGKNVTALRNGGNAALRTAPETETETETEAERKNKKEHEPLARIDLDKELYRRGAEVLGSGSGGIVTKLKTSLEGNVAKTRAVIETASTKHNPREYVGAIIRGHDQEKPYSPII